MSYVLLTKEECTIFIDQQKLSEEAIKHFQQEKINVKNYEEIFSDLKKISNEKNTGKVLLDKNKISVAVFNCFNNDSVVFNDSPIDLMKGIKNETEIMGMKNCHVRDGAAKTEFLAWLEKRLEEGGKIIY